LTAASGEGRQKARCRVGPFVPWVDYSDLARATEVPGSRIYPMHQSRLVDHRGLAQEHAPVGYALSGAMELRETGD
jgi:hypothetical protein